MSTNNKSARVNRHYHRQARAIAYVCVCMYACVSFGCGFGTVLMALMALVAWLFAFSSPCCICIRQLQLLPRRASRCVRRGIRSCRHPYVHLKHGRMGPVRASCVELDCTSGGKVGEKGISERRVYHRNGNISIVWLHQH